MENNVGKSHFLVTTITIIDIRIENWEIKNCHHERILGVAFDHKLTFDNHLSDFCKKVHALARVSAF